MILSEIIRSRSSVTAVIQAELSHAPWTEGKETLYQSAGSELWEGLQNLLPFWF